MRWYWLVAVVLGGCPSTPPPACLADAPDPTCGSLYVPTFDNVYTNTLAKNCGSTNSSCHSASGHQDGLSFADEQTAYNDLLAPSGKDPKRDRVVPGDIMCSLMLVRVESVGADYQMPPGNALDPRERCALVQWVNNGAPGPGSGSAL
jgi:hypothetical protein